MFPSNLSTVNEAIADDAAVNILASSFNFIRKDMGEPKIGNIDEKNYRKLYWIFAMKRFCATIYPYSDRIKSDLFSKAKVDFALQHSNDFRAAFRCSVGEPSGCTSW